MVDVVSSCEKLIFEEAARFDQSISERKCRKKIQMEDQNLLWLSVPALFSDGGKTIFNVRKSYKTHFHVAYFCPGDYFRTFMKLSLQLCEMCMRQSCTDWGTKEVLQRLGQKQL